MRGQAYSPGTAQHSPVGDSGIGVELQEIQAFMGEDTALLGL
jgi:hypothetical protein